MKRLRDKIGETITRMQGKSAEELIEALNPIIRGWTNYYRYVNSSKAFAKLRWWVWRRVWEWAKRQHHNKGAKWIKEKYFVSVKGSNWRFQAKKKDGTVITLVEPTDYKTRHFIKVQSGKNPFAPQDRQYFEQREKTKVILATNL